MRKREMSYSDYGMTDNEVRYIKDFCYHADEEQKNSNKKPNTHYDYKFNC